jgi:hypothetical protein
LGPASAVTRIDQVSGAGFAHYLQAFAEADDGAQSC